MGMYTEIVVNICLKEGTPENVIALLRVMGGELPVPKITLPDHDLFAVESRWRSLFCCSSYYHVPLANFRLETDSYGSWSLSARGDLKNYNNEIDNFFDWIQPYITEHFREFIGYSLYEESKEPTLYFRGNQAS